MAIRPSPAESGDEHSPETRRPLPLAEVIVPSRREGARLAPVHVEPLGQSAVATRAPSELRRWVQLRDGVLPPAPAGGPNALCASLLGEGVSPAACAERLEVAFGAEVIEAFARTPHGDPAVQGVAVALRRASATRRCAAALGALRELLLGTCTPAGRRVLVHAARAWPEASRAVMSALLVDELTKGRVLQDAAVLGPRLHEAVRLGRREAWERSLTQRLAGGDRGALESWGARIAVGLEPLEDGILRQAAGGFASLEAHLSRVASTLSPLASQLESAPLELLEAAATGKATGAMPAPWPVFAALVQRTTSWSENLHVEQRAEGIGRLVEAMATRDLATPREPRGAGFTPAALLLRQATSERAARRHDEIPARLAETWLQVLSGVLPCAAGAKEGGASLRQRLERALLMPRTEEATAAAVERALEVVLEALPRGLLPFGQRDLRRLRGVALALAAVWTSPLPVGERRATPLARAVLLVTAALDPDLRASCASQEGYSFVVAALYRYGAATVSRGLQMAIAAGEQSSTAMAPALLSPIRPARPLGWLPS